MGGGSSKKQDTEAGGSVATPGLAEQKNLSNSLPEEPPDFLVCPITQELMTDPVFTADGHTFERSAITAWLSNNDTNPMTGDNMKNKDLIPNFAIREACDAYRQKHPDNLDSIKRYNSALSNISGGNGATQQASTGASSTPNSEFFTALQSPSESLKTIPSSNASEDMLVSLKSFHPNTDSSAASGQFLSSSASFASSQDSPLCGLCGTAATSKSKVGNDWILVCDACRELIVEQQNFSSAPSRRKSFKAVSALDAGSDIEFSASAISNNDHGGGRRSPHSNVERPGNRGTTNPGTTVGHLINPCKYCHRNEATTRSKIGNVWKPVCNGCYMNLSPTRKTSKFTALPPNEQRTVEFKT